MRPDMNVTTEGLVTAHKALQRSVQIAPGAIARALNATLDATREKLIEDARERYAVNAAGDRHLNDLKRTSRAESARLSAEMKIAKMRNDLGYFETMPNVPLPGRKWRQAPSGGYMGHVLRSTPMKTLEGKGNKSKAFLARFKSGHVGMVQRVIGSSSRNTVTANGFMRWRNKAGKVEKLETLGSPSAAAMINTVWPGGDEKSAEFFFDRLDQTLQGG